MAAHIVDLTLARQLKKYGASDTDACFNCGNCTAVCQHSVETASFPRRLIRYGQLGMRDRLMAARETWLCWNCRDCSDTCPRQARPSEYLEAVRRYTIASLDPTRISHLMYTSRLFLVGFALFLAALFAGVLLSGADSPGTGPLDMFGFIPFELIHDLGIAVMAVIGLAAVVSTARLVMRLFRSLGPVGVEPVAGSALERALFATREVLGEMLVQRRFRSCESDDRQLVVLRPWFVHYSMMWGFIGLVVATIIAFLFKTPGELVPLWYPSRLLGTVAGLFLMYGVTVTIVRRWRSTDPNQSRMLPSDWLFIGLLFVVGLTGFVLEALVYAPEVGTLGYAVFLMHVALAMELLVLLPFTKFAHALYRPLVYWIYLFRTGRPADASFGLSEAE